MRTLTLIRGVPGSGKSTLAHKLLVAEGTRGNTAAHYEADMYFVESDGVYRFNPKFIKSAHAWCQKAAREAMVRGVESIIVSNTFVKLWEMDHYKTIAKDYGYKVIEIICHSDFESVHNVPIETIERMRGNFEYWDQND